MIQRIQAQIFYGSYSLTNRTNQKPFWKEYKSGIDFPVWAMLWYAEAKNAGTRATCLLLGTLVAASRNKKQGPISLARAKDPENLCWLPHFAGTQPHFGPVYPSSFVSFNLDNPAKDTAPKIEIGGDLHCKLKSSVLWNPASVVASPTISLHAADTYPASRNQPCQMCIFESGSLFPRLIPV